MYLHVTRAVTVALTETVMDNRMIQEKPRRPLIQQRITGEPLSNPVTSYSRCSITDDGVIGD